MDNNTKTLDYQQFYDELIEKEYLPDKIDYSWTDRNEDYMREILFLLYMAYTKTSNKNTPHTFLKLYSEIMSITHAHFPEEQGYF